MPELTIMRGGTETVLPVKIGARLSDVLNSNGIHLPSPCGGRGTCGKCAVMVSGNVSSPSPAEKLANTRLACQVVLLGNASASLPHEQVMEGIELGSDCAILPAAPMEGAFGVAVDVGTTTIALNLYDLQTGACLFRCGMQNPQTSIGSDVMSRIGAGVSGDLPRLEAQVTEAVSTLLAQSCAAAGIDSSRVGSIVITGNTAMLYFLTGQDPTSLSRAPFDADCLFGEFRRVCGRQAFLPRCMHAFVGADMTCAILASGICNQQDAALLCDVGTNGEIALWTGKELLVTSTAAGPAFEGAGISCGCGSVRGAIDAVSIHHGRPVIHTIGDEPAVGVCGSGLMDAVAVALELGLCDETGFLKEGCFRLKNEIPRMGSDAQPDEIPRMGSAGRADEVSRTEPAGQSPEIILTQDDIRAVQMAKGAIAAGIETLLDEAGITAKDVGIFGIAGGFGSHLNVDSAAAIGLFPKCLTPKAKVLGNAALQGAAMMLLNRNEQERANRLAGLARHVSLGGNQKFNERYIECMGFLR